MDSGSWQPDPTRRHELRWWTGTQWSDQVADHGVTTNDPLHPLAAPQPTAPPLPVTSIGAATAPAAGGGRSGSRRTVLLLGGAAGLVGLVAAVTFVLTKDDGGSQVGAATTTATSVPTSSTAIPTTTNTTAATSTSAVPSTAASTTVAPSTTAQVAVTAEALLGIMPGADDVPADWSRYSEPYTDLTPRSGPGYGFCGGDNAVARANELGSTAAAEGPSWDLPNGGWFGVTIYAFATPDTASAYLASTADAANSCMTEPVQYDTTEGDLDFFDETVADDVSWHIAEGSLALAEPTPDAAEMVRTVLDSYASITLDGYDYSVTMTYFSRIERHGSVVVEFWLYGNWDYRGWSEEAPWAFQPTDAALDAAAATIRPVIVERLRTSGAL